MPKTGRILIASGSVSAADSFIQLSSATSGVIEFSSSTSAFIKTGGSGFAGAGSYGYAGYDFATTGNAKLKMTWDNNDVGQADDCGYFIYVDGASRRVFRWAGSP
jgi:hypothetical protein